MAASPTYRLIHGDCLDVMRTMDAASVDAVVTDPPYFRVKGDAWDRQWDDPEAFLSWLGTVADEWRRVLKPNGSLYCFTSPEMNTRVEMMLRSRFLVLNNIRWTKRNGWHKKAEKESLRAYLSPWEGIIFAEQRGDAYAEAERALHKDVYAPIGRRVTEIRERAGLARWQVDEACSPSRKPTGLCYRWEEGACLPTEEQFAALCRLAGIERDYEALRRDYEALRRDYEALRRPFSLHDYAECSDVWAFETVPPTDGKHPCEKPVPLLTHIIEASTSPGAVVLDTFGGSGATGVACQETGRHAILIEREAEYVKIAEARLKHASRAPMLPFGERETQAITAHLAWSAGVSKDEAEKAVKDAQAKGAKGLEFGVGEGKA